MIEWYIQFIWNPINQLQGGIVESLPFSFTNLFIYNGLICLIYYLTQIVKYKRRFKFHFYPTLSILILILQLGGQGATPFGTSAIFYRTTIVESSEIPPIDSIKNQEQLIYSQQQFLKSYSIFKDTTQKYWIPQINKWLNQSLKQLYPNQVISPRDPQIVKDYSGISRLFGLAYGGPAFSDPIISEISMANSKDYPIPFSARLKAWVHELAHAKGFGSEEETEILTFHALLNSGNPQVQAIAYQMVLQKNRVNYQLPKDLWEQWQSSRVKFKEVRQNNYAVYFLRGLLKKLSIQNSSHKYGTVNNPNEFNSKNNFLKASYYFIKQIKGPHGF